MKSGCFHEIMWKTVIETVMKTTVKTPHTWLALPLHSMKTK